MVRSAKQLAFFESALRREGLECGRGIGAMRKAQARRLARARARLSEKRADRKKFNKYRQERDRDTVIAKIWERQKAAGVRVQSLGNQRKTKWKRGKKEMAYNPGARHKHQESPFLDSGEAARAYSKYLSS